MHERNWERSKACTQEDVHVSEQPYKHSKEITNLLVCVRSDDSKVERGA